MAPKIMNHAATVSAKPRPVANTSSSSAADFATLGRAPLRFTLNSRRLTSRDLQIVEATEELLEADVPEPEGVASNVSLLRGFNATIPSAEKGRSRRRQTRNVDAPTLGLKKHGIHSRGLLAEEEDHEHASVASEEDMVVVGRLEPPKAVEPRKRGRQSIGASKILGKEELKRQTNEILKDKDNLQVRRVCAFVSFLYQLSDIAPQTLINNEVAEITNKIEALDAIRAKLEQDLLRLQEDELELDDEREFLLFCFRSFNKSFHSGRCSRKDRF